MTTEPAEVKAQQAPLTTKETAELLGLSEWVVRKACGRGEIPHFRVGHHIRIPATVVERLLAGESVA